MAPPDAWLARQNAALKLRAHRVTLDVSQGRVRLRATMPPPPSASPGTPPKQQRISTGLSYPDQATEALQMAELLGSALERHRLGIEPFDWNPWLPKKKGSPESGRAPKPLAGRDHRPRGDPYNSCLVGAAATPGAARCQLRRAC